MRVLEARFYPRGRAASEYVAVARVRCYGSRDIQVEPLRWDETVSRLNAEAALAKIRFLARSYQRDPANQLLALRSNYWAFVEVVQH